MNPTSIAENTCMSFYQLSEQSPEIAKSVAAKFGSAPTSTLMVTKKPAIPPALATYLGEVPVGTASKQQVFHVYSAEQTNIIHDDVLLQENATLSKQDRKDIINSLGGSIPHL